MLRRWNGVSTTAYYVDLTISFGTKMRTRHLQFVESAANIGEDVINGTFGGNLGALGGIGVHDGLGVLVEGVEALLDGLNVVVGSAAGLAAFQQTSSHGFVRDLKVENLCAGGDTLFKFFSLRDFPGVAIDEEALGASQFADHGLGEEIEDNLQGNQVTFLHDGEEFLASGRPGVNFSSQKISAGQVGEAILGHNLVALSSLATSRSSENPDNGQLGCGQSAAIHGHDAIDIFAVVRN